MRYDLTFFLTLAQWLFVTKKLLNIMSINVNILVTLNESCISNALCNEWQSLNRIFHQFIFKISVWYLSKKCWNLFQTLKKLRISLLVCINWNHSPYHPHASETIWFQKLSYVVLKKMVEPTQIFLKLPFCLQLFYQHISVSLLHNMKIIS